MKAFFPILILLLVATPASLWPQRSLFFRVAGWREALGGNGPLPIFVEKFLCFLVESRNERALLSLLARRGKKPDN
jgi:hypothetical protein